MDHDAPDSRSPSSQKLDDAQIAVEARSASREALPNAQALGSVMDELLGIEESRLVEVNVEVAAATDVVIGAARGIRGLRREMVRWFGEEMASAVDRLELLARAVAQADGRHRAAKSGVDLEPLAESVGDVRAALSAEVSSLDARKLVSRASLGVLRGGRGYRSLGFDVLQLAAFLSKRWPAIEHATGLTIGEIERAEALANQLITAASLRTHGPASPTGDVLRRAFTLLRETYDDARRMVTFLRWKDGDADRIAPSLHRARKRQRRAPAPTQRPNSSAEKPA